MNTLQKAFIVALASIIPAALVAHALIPIIAIVAGLIGGLLTIFCYFKEKEKKALIAEIVAAIVGSQIGWVALLI